MIDPDEKKGRFVLVVIFTVLGLILISVLAGFGFIRLCIFLWNLSR